MRRHTLLAACMFVAACLMLFGKTLGSASDGKSQRLASDPAPAAKRVVVQAAGHGNPYINFEDGVELPASYEGAAEMQSLLKQNAAEPRALASADYDEDGVPDLICGYARAGGGIITLYRGNVDSIYENSPEAQRRKADGTFTDSAFLSPARVFEAPIAADFVGAGDFDADGHWDVVIGARGGKELYLLPGDGRGNFLSARKIALPGAVTSLITGEINRADGLTDVVVGVVTDDGPKALVFEGPEGALKASPEIFSLPGEPKALALGQFDGDYPMDLAVGAGSELVIIHGRDRKLSLDHIRQAEVLPARLDRRAFRFEIRSIAAGDFNGTNETSLALLASDGTVHLTSAQKQVADRKAAKKKGGGANDPELFGRWPGATQLVSLRVSTGPADDLVILNKDGHSLPIQKTGLAAPARSALSSSVRVGTSLDLDAEPAAVLSMRLNGDALGDLVVLQGSASAPAILKTAAPQTFTVNKADDHDDGMCDSGDCTLREAINASNANSGVDLIAFNIPGAGVHTIMPASVLPEISDPVTIDGSTQPGFAGTPIIELSGLGSGLQQLNGLTVSAGNSTIRNLVMNNFRGVSFGNGILLTTNGNNVIEGNYIGTNAAGTAGTRNDTDGIRSNGSSNNRIGGTATPARNIVSANARIGVEIVAADGNLVQGNFLGTDVTGNHDLGNAFAGVFIVAGQPTNIVGGTTAGARNLISGNDSAGVKFISGGSIAQGNYIGTNAGGTARLPNYRGVDLGDDSDSLIGGTTNVARNIISGNDQEGIAISGGPASRNLIEGNFIGTDLSGTSALGNSHFGVIINSGSNNVVGGASSGASNLIAFNAFGGIAISGGLGIPFQNSILGNTIFSNAGSGISAFDGRSTMIQGNSIFSNGELGIDLAPFGVTPNDACDVDGGPNDRQNYPLLTSASSTGISVTIQGTLNSTPGATFTIEFFANNTCDLSGFGQGQTFIGSAMVTTATNCGASFSISLPAGVPVGQLITATATDPTGNTSEFSQCLEVQPAPFDLCLQDESNGNILLVNSTTGEYQFNNCRGTTLTGIGSLSRKACLVTLQVNGPDRRILARIDTCSKTGNASIQLLTQGTSFSILDRNTANNTCACAGPG